MEFDLVEFTDLIRTYLYGFFPLESDDMAISKHPHRPLHIRDIAFMWLPTSTSADGNMITFDIGSEYAEEYYPYYHILQDAPYIRKKNMGSDKTKGSQRKIHDLSQRDYGRVRFNGKTFSKEYSRNVRGERKKITDTTKTFSYRYGKHITIERDTNSYQNVHYKYIDKILDNTLPMIADYFGMKMGRKQDTGLEEEYNAQYKQDSINLAVGNWDLDILDIMTSFD